MKCSRREWLQFSGRSIGASLALPMVPKTISWNCLTDERLENRNAVSSLTKDELPTPALILDLDLFEKNLQKMALHARATAIQLRPHAKTHKCTEIAKRQLRAGAVGVCVSTIHEAEVMAASGVNGLLITSEMAGQEKIKRLVRLTLKHPEIMSVVDNLSHVAELSAAAVAAKVTLNVMIDIDPGGRRTGVLPGPAVVKLAETVMGLPRLRLRGVNAYSGKSSHVVGFEERQRHSREAMEPALETYLSLKKRGFPVEIMSGGSTGTYNVDSKLGGMTELQVGSYIFMDAEYRSVGGQSGPLYDDFAPSLTVLTTVISNNHPGLVTVDAGVKALATDRPILPEPKVLESMQYQFAGDEHGMVTLNGEQDSIRLGSRLEFIVPHCDPTVNLYESIYCLRGQKVEDVWKINARGHS